MELKEFVAETLTQILEGVSNAHSKAKELGGEVNPHLMSDHKEMSKYGILWAGGQAAPVVQFDVALTVVEGSGVKAGIGVFGGAINIGTSGESTNENTSVSRVKFSVPVVLPSDK